MMKIVNESFVTDYIDPDVLYKVMNRTPEFGDFTDYQPLEGMVVRTSVTPVYFPGKLTQSRYWKFVRGENWEVYEVDSQGRDLGKKRFIIRNI